MSESRRELTKTTHTIADYTRAVVAAWSRLYGSPPSEGTCGVLWAQYALETGRGVACWNNNIGNVKHVRGDGYDYVELPNTWEIIGGKKVVFQPPDPQTWFRVYESLADAMVDHLRFLERRYGNAWSSILSGDPAGFAHALKARGYYTAAESDYARGLASLVKEFQRSGAYAAADVAPPPSTVPEIVEPRNPDTASAGIANDAAAEYQRTRLDGDP